MAEVPTNQSNITLAKFPANSHLQFLKEINGVRGSFSTDILFPELGLKSQQHVWLLRAAKSWNNLAGQPHGTVYSSIALDGCRVAVGSSRRNWARSMIKAIALQVMS